MCAVDLGSFVLCDPHTGLQLYVSTTVNAIPKPGCVDYFVDSPTTLSDLLSGWVSFNTAFALVLDFHEPGHDLDHLNRLGSQIVETLVTAKVYRLCFLHNPL